MASDETHFARIALFSCAVLLVTVGAVTAVLAAIGSPVIVLEP